MSVSDNSPIHIIEPTLRDEAGHCHSLIANLAACSQRPQLVVWADKQVELPQLAALNGLELQAHFSRRLRRVQAYFLFRRLLKQPGKILISTAGRTDLHLMHWAAGKHAHKNKIFFYVHWLALSEKKQQQLKKIAARRPEFHLLTTTHSAAESLRACGFTSVQHIAYPVAASERAPAAPFKHVLMAGAARQDKGILQVIDYIEYLSKSKLAIPMAIQTSAEHYGKLDEVARAAIDRLDSIQYPHLIRQRNTLSTQEYQAMYHGAICLQPYDPVDFADRVSGVTLDALRAGAPVITTGGTWMARIVERFDAGVVLSDRSVSSLHNAVEKIRHQFSRYQGNARRASLSLESENSAQHLIDALMAAQ